MRWDFASGISFALDRPMQRDGRGATRTGGRISAEGVAGHAKSWTLKAFRSIA